MCQWTDGLLYNGFDMTFCCFIMFYWWSDRFAWVSARFCKQESHTKASHPKELWDWCPLKSCSQSISVSVSQTTTDPWIFLAGADKAFRYLAVECRAIWISGQQFGHWSRVFESCASFFDVLVSIPISPAISSGYAWADCTVSHESTNAGPAESRSRLRFKRPLRWTVPSTKMPPMLHGTSWDWQIWVDLQLCNPGWMVLWGWNCYHTTS